MLRLKLIRTLARVHNATPALTSRARSIRHASGQSEPKGNATGLEPGTEDQMKPGKDNVSKDPAQKRDPTPNVEGGEGKGEEVHPAKRAEPQPEPTRGTGIKAREEMG